MSLPWSFSMACKAPKLFSAWEMPALSGFVVYRSNAFKLCSKPKVYARWRLFGMATADLHIPSAAQVLHR